MIMDIFEIVTGSIAIASLIAAGFFKYIREDDEEATWFLLLAILLYLVIQKVKR